ncbi:hypothetical protein N7468_004081 [Penicillium chermesinum]|uniref:Uncharacterized protein n=1 Tax=Penicillium chermesinum TaxID=63820 RepID=A0A9W9P7Y3_9EURO|nr:uncharacterized protein N7468_004081 [Penicillium chermesinum]KAJ5239462.1 hypothetical protein N7468_004081 [Penicillium chermesinum]KAJ6141280.1 hypothetical protein N7470_010176 [Penicillium chermesinum]
MDTRQYNTAEDRGLLGRNPLFLHHVRSSRSVSSSGTYHEDRDNSSVSSLGPNEGQPLDQPLEVNGGFSDVDIDPQASKPETARWAPYTFSPYFLGTLSIVALGLCLTTFLLWWRSSTNNGLGPDDGSSAVLFGWRYSPTLITVIYIQLTSMLFNDVKRTEPFARLARPEGATASTSILHTPGPWWVALYDGFAKKKNGSRSWILICASFVNIIGFLAISPLSSAYLYSEKVHILKPTDFFQLSPSAQSPLPLDQDRTTNFRAIANLLQNVSTSPWITDDYTILPFWPASSPKPINTLPTSPSETWKGQTTMFKSELSCTKMKLEAEANSSYSFQEHTSAEPAVSMMWSAPNGCKYGMEVSYPLFENGGGSWSNASSFLYAEDLTVLTGQVSSRVNSTAACDGHELLMVTDPWTTVEGTFTAQLCETKYYMANITASVALAGTSRR